MELFTAIIKAAVIHIMSLFKAGYKLVLIGLLIAISQFVNCTSNSRKIENLSSFAKAYGYVKYFHPSDEASQINWAKFSAYGADKIEKCSTNEQVVATLNNLFNPIAPSVKFSVSKSKPDYDVKIITPNRTQDYRFTYWQHLGVEIGLIKNNCYKSIRVGSGSNPETGKLFESQPAFGRIITKEIGDKIYCQFPVVLYRNDKNTYPQADSLAFKKLQAEIEKVDYYKDRLFVRLGNVIHVYNVFQHFYPYFDVVKVDWENELKKALSKCYTDKSLKDELVTLEKFTAPLKDGHISVNLSNSNVASIPISWEWIEDKLVVTGNKSNNPNINVGDIVTRIDGVTPEKYFDEVKSRISAGTSGWLSYRANMLSLIGERGSVMKLTINGKQVEMTRNCDPYYMERVKKVNAKTYCKMGDSIMYLKMSQVHMDTINQLLPTLAKCKAIICDARGYPNGNHLFITHLMQKDDTTTSWMQVPQIIYPDHQEIAGYYHTNWISRMKAKKPYLGDKKIVYIIDGSAISYAESCLGFIEGYKLATLVGQPTAGTNGNVNPFYLPGGFTISWTGMKVLKHNGSQHHGIGILPNVYVTKTIKGIKEGRDEFLDKAIEIANNK